jgi:transposase
VRGDDEQSGHLFSSLSPEQRVPADHPLRAIRTMTDEALRRLSPQFERLYAKTGRPSIPPEHLLRALLLQVLYSVRSERMLMEQLAYNLLFRWFVGLGMDDPVWVPTTFTKNRDRLLEGDIARAFFEDGVEQARGRHLLSAEHFTVDGTLLEAWAGLKSLSGRISPVPRRTIQAIRRSISMGTDGRTRRINPRPTPTAGCSRRRKAMKPSWPFSAKC